MSTVVSNATDPCGVCEGSVECAPTAVLLIALVHALYGQIGPDPDHFGKQAEKEKPQLKDVGGQRGRTSSVEMKFIEDDIPKKEVDNTEEYDFVIVGGGTAGCVLASRLSENRNWKVLLIEAGPEEPKISLIPALGSELRGSSIDWRYTMRPKNGFCQNQREGCEVIQGRVLGGSSVINDMIYLRGSPADYDKWASLGNDGWDFNSVLPFFKYSEGNYDRDISKNSYYHSTQGPLDIGRYPHIDDNVDALLSALSELRLNYTDLNGKNQLGFMRVQTTSYFGERISAYTAFVEPIVKVRTNLHVISEALVTKIILNTEDDFVRAIGVEYLKSGTKFKALASKEVIISAGTINSPKLLMQSGLGPKSYLDYLGIPVYRDLPVGANFHDHLSVCLPVIKLGKTSTNVPFREKLKDITTYYAKGIGPMAANIQVLALLEILVPDENNAPDIMLHFKGHLSPMYYDKLDMCISLLTPKSRGQVMLNATDPLLGIPLIYPNYLKEIADTRKLLDAIQIAIRLFDTNVFKSVEYDFDPRAILDNECKENKRVTDDFWLCIIKQFSEPLHNYVGTCKMGPLNDPEAIVDNELRIYGVGKLRIIDASIIPVIPRAPTAAAVMMIAEKASNLIKSFWN